MNKLERVTNIFNAICKGLDDGSLQWDKVSSAYWHFAKLQDKLQKEQNAEFFLELTKGA